MIFLIEYDREISMLVSVTVFPSEALGDAEQARLKLELELNAKGVEREVVLLEADDAESLHRTHERYFKPLGELSVPAS